MANERISDEVTKFLRGQYNSSVTEAHQAIEDGRVDDSRAAVRRASAIDVAQDEIKKHYSAIDRIHQELGFPIPPLEMLFQITPDVAPTIEEDHVSANASVLPEEEVEIPVLTVPVAIRLPVEEVIIAVSKPVERAAKPVIPATAEKTDDVSREDRIIVATFGLNYEKTRLQNMTYANSVTSAFSDVLPPLHADSVLRHDAFSAALAEYKGMLAELLDVTILVERSPRDVTDIQKRRIEKLRQYLTNQGYPVDINAFEIKEIAYRHQGFSFQEFMDNRKSREILSAGEDGSTQIFPARKARRELGGHRAIVTEDSRESGRRPKRRIQQPEASTLRTRLVIPEGHKLEIAPLDKILGKAIFSLNEDKTPVLPNLAAVAEDVFVNELTMFEGQARKDAVQGLIKTKITPFIIDRSRAVVAAMGTLRENSKFGDRLLAREVQYFLEVYSYPNDLSAHEIASLMSKQLTLPIILERRDGGNKTTLESKPAEREVTEPNAAVNGKTHKDKLTDAQRAYLDAAFATKPKGGMLNKTRDEIAQALYPNEWKTSLDNPDRRHNVGQLRGHVSRVGSKVSAMVAEALRNGTGPAELRAYINNLRTKPEFSELPDDILLAYAVR